MCSFKAFERELAKKRENEALRDARYKQRLEQQQEALRRKQLVEAQKAQKQQRREEEEHCTQQNVEAREVAEAEVGVFDDEEEEAETVLDTVLEEMLLDPSIQALDATEQVNFAEAYCAACFLE